MREILYCGGGVASTLGCYILLRSLLQSEPLCKENYAGKHIPAVGGLVAIVSFLGSACVFAVLPREDLSSSVPQSLIIVVIGFGFIGLLDDLVGDKTRQGFSGHVSALVSGSITTGAIKLFGGPALALIAFAPSISSLGYLEVILSVVGVSLIANLFNLLDLAPGRCTKYSLFTLVICAIIAHEFTFQFWVIGMIAVLLVCDVREKFMLGDTGANALGALVGVFVVSLCSLWALWAVCVVAFLLNLVSEKISFSSIIGQVLPLRIFDEWGQTPSRREWSKSRKSN